MHRLTLLAALTLSTLAAAGDPQDAPGSRDPALFTRMKGFHIYTFEEKEFERFEFPLSLEKTQAVEGAYVNVNYSVNDDVKPPSALQITRNYANAAKAIGGAVVADYEDGGNQQLTVKVTRGGAETWAFVQAGNGRYSVQLVEKQAMAQSVTANAGVMASGLKATGRIALYGIFFDTDKAELKPTSEPTLVEIVKLLDADPQLKLYVVGHTDSVGTFEPNVKLSQARAAAVVAALLKKRVAAARLKPFGAGPTSPVEPNTSDAGRAKNRRVELVAQ